MNCKVCGHELDTSSNYPSEVTRGVGICSPCWVDKTPSHIHEHQKDKYFEIKKAKNK